MRLLTSLWIFLYTLFFEIYQNYGQVLPKNIFEKLTQKANILPNFS